MSSSYVLLIIVVYFFTLLLVSYFVGKRNTDNDAFFLGNRESPWWLVAIGMVGSSISGVSFVSVPGLVQGIDFTYLQTVFGFFFGYLIIANVLLPLYYRLNLTTIYTYLFERFGQRAYKTGASFFLLSKTIGASARLYVVALILQQLIFDAWQVPFAVTVSVTVLLIWLYTFRSGIKTIVWTDALQTIVMVIALVLMVVEVISQLGMDIPNLCSTLVDSERTRIFVLDDWQSKQHFVKQFFSGIFIAIVMTGLDQDMMQKNLTCKSLPEAKKNMVWYGISFVPINFLFLVLGAMLLMLASKNGIPLPALPDEILPLFASTYLGQTVLVLFFVGIIAAAFSSADSALATLTTSFAIDILGVQHQIAPRGERNRKLIHFAVSVLFVFIILIFKAFNDKSVIDAIYTIASYTYGPLLGMYAFGLFTKRKANDKIIPYIALASPFLSYGLNVWLITNFQYHLGYELLMINGMITFVGMFFFSSKYRIDMVCD